MQLGALGREKGVANRSREREKGLGAVFEMGGRRWIVGAFQDHDVAPQAA
jgi:hypothetical protein